MKVYLWRRVKYASSNYHPEGGVVVFAEDEPSARSLASAAGANIADDEVPDRITECVPCDRTAYIFPDAGCC